MKKPTIYVKVNKKGNENMYKFGCKGYGWVCEEDLNNDFINIQCEDNYGGARAWGAKKEDIIICANQKENIYN